MEASDRELRRRDLTMFARTSWSLQKEGGVKDVVIERDEGRRVECKKVG